MTSNAHSLATSLVAALRDRAWRCVTAESCTGGGIASAITSVAGSSDVFDRGYVSYSNAAKADMLGVDPGLIAREGAVSEAVARAMAAGACAHSGAGVAVAVTGIAGPGGGTPEKPVGTVAFAFVVPGQPVRAETLLFSGDRDSVRDASVRHALRVLLSLALQRPDDTTR